MYIYVYGYMYMYTCVYIYDICIQLHILRIKVMHTVIHVQIPRGKLIYS